MEQGVKIGFIVSSEIPDASEIASDSIAVLPCNALKPARYIVGCSGEPQAIRLLGDLKKHDSIAVAFVFNSPTFDYINHEAFYGSPSTGSMALTFLIRVGQLGAELQQITPNQFTVNSPKLVASIKEHARIFKWSAAMENMIADIKIKMSGEGKPRPQEAKAATIKILQEGTRLTLPLVSHVKGNTTAKMRVEELVGLLDDIVQRSAYKPLVQINTLLKNVLFVCDDTQMVKAEVVSE